MPVDPKVKAALKEKYGNEQVFVIPFAEVSNIGDKFTSLPHDQNIWEKFDNVGKYAFRYDVEGEPALQQLIPYVLIQNPVTKKYLVAKRLQGESRLVGKISMGFGGHINPCDGNQEVLFKALFREVHEELIIEPKSSARFIGYVRGLNSSTNDHLGCVFIVDAEDAKINEHENLKGEWMSIEDMEKSYYKLEDWTRHIVDYLVDNKEFK